MEGITTAGETRTAPKATRTALGATHTEREATRTTRRPSTLMDETTQRDRGEPTQIPGPDRLTTGRSGEVNSDVIRIELVMDRCNRCRCTCAFA